MVQQAYAALCCPAQGFLALFRQWGCERLITRRSLASSWLNSSSLAITLAIMVELLLVSHHETFTPFSAHATLKISPSLFPWSFSIAWFFKLHFPEPPPSDAWCKSAQWRRPRQSFRNVIFLNFNLSSAHAAQASRQNLPRAPFPASFNRLIVFWSHLRLLDLPYVNPPTPIAQDWRLDCLFSKPWTPLIATMHPRKDMQGLAMTDPPGLTAVWTRHGGGAGTCCHSRDSPRGHP